MVGTILPVVYGNHEIGRFRTLPLWGFVIAGAVAGAGTGIIAGWIGAAVSAPSRLLGLLVPIIGLLAARDVGIIQMPLLQRNRQVPRSWSHRWRPFPLAVAYGASLGTAVATRINVAVIYAPLIWVVFTGDSQHGAFLMGLFGFARGAPLLAFPPRVGRSSVDLDVTIRSFYGFEEVATAAAGLVGAATCGCLLMWTLQVI